MTGTQEISAAFPCKSNFVEVRGSKQHSVEEGKGKLSLDNRRSARQHNEIVAD